MQDLPEDNCIESQHLHETRASDPSDVDDMITTIDGSLALVGNNENVCHTGSGFHDRSPIFEALDGVDDTSSVENVVGINIIFDSHDESVSFEDCI